MPLDPVTIGALISGAGGLIGGTISSRASEPMRREATDLARNIGATSALRQTSIRDLLRGYSESGVNSPLINLINSGLMNYFQPTEDIAGTPEYKMAQANIRQNYEEAASGILNTLAARGAIRSGATQSSLELLGRTRLAQEREAYVALSALRDARMQAAVKAAIDIVTGSSTEEAITAMSGFETAATEAEKAGNAITTGITSIGQAITTAATNRARPGVTPPPPVTPPPVVSSIIPPPVEDIGSIVTAGTEPIVSGVGDVITSTTGTSITDLMTEMSSVVAPSTGTATSILGLPISGVEALTPTGTAAFSGVAPEVGLFGTTGSFASILGWAAGIGAIAYPMLRSLLSGRNYNTPQQSANEAIEQAGMGGVTLNRQEVLDFFNQMSFESEGKTRTDTWQNWINAYYGDPKVKAMIDERFGGLPVWLRQLQSGWQDYQTSSEWLTGLSIGGGA